MANWVFLDYPGGEALMRHVYRSPAEAQRIRALACEQAARVMAGRPDEPLLCGLWQAAAFFESYITMGHAATERDFGPKAPVKLSLVKNA